MANTMIQKTALLAIFLLSAVNLQAQVAMTLLDKTARSLKEGRTDYAVSLFRQAAQDDVEKAEMFYWTRVEKTAPYTFSFASVLAEEFKAIRNYDKAFLFYKECMQLRPDEVSLMANCARMQFMRGNESDARQLYEHVIQLDADNLEANIFLGNYFFLQAEKEKTNLETTYKKITQPTRMQYARYRDGLSEIFSNSYIKARTYLQRVMTMFPSSEAGTTLERINVVEKEVNHK